MVIENIIRLAPDSWRAEFFRTHQQDEVDLVLLAPDGRRVGIEIKHASAPTRSERSHRAFDLLELGERFVLTAGRKSYELSGGARVLPYAEFLRNPPWSSA